MDWMEGGGQWGRKTCEEEEKVIEIEEKEKKAAEQASKPIEIKPEEKKTQAALDAEARKQKNREKKLLLKESTASLPLVTVVTLYPFSLRNNICGFKRSISSSAHNMVVSCMIVKIRNQDLTDLND